jgi:hypothetical protein
MALFVACDDRTIRAMVPVECTFTISKTRLRELTRTLPGEVTLWRGKREFMRPERAVGKNIVRITKFRNDEGNWTEYARVERRVCYFSDPDAAFHFRLLI